MPIDIEVWDAGVGYFITATGSLLGEEFVDWIRDHFARDETRFRKNRYSITDLSGVTATDIGSGHVRTLKLLGDLTASRVNPDRVVAIVAPKDVTFGLARMLQSVADQVPWDIAVFRSRSEAEEWVRERMSERFGIQSITFRGSGESSTVPSEEQP